MTADDIERLGIAERSVPAGQLAARILTELSPRELRTLAAELIERWIYVARRVDSGMSDVSAIRTGFPSPPPPKKPKPGDSGYVPPADYLTLRHTPPDLADPWDFLGPTTRKERDDFRNWMGDAFPRWYKERHAMIAGLPLARRFQRDDSSYDLLEWFEDNWHPRGSMQSRGERLERQFQAAMEQARQQGRREATRELVDPRTGGGNGEPRQS
jgi:hypothetical protein